MNMMIGRNLKPKSLVSKNNKNFGISYFSNLSKVSFDGFINENLFKIEEKENKLLENIEIMSGSIKNPLTYKKENYLGLLYKSKYDGVGNREPIDLSISLDISGSMNSIDNKTLSKEQSKSRIELAQESLCKLIDILDETNDKMALNVFNNKVKIIYGLTDKKEIKNKYISEINNLNANGGTNLLEALKVSIQNFGDNINNKTKLKRIVMITDAMYNDTNNRLKELFKKCVEEYNISITIMTISEGSNNKLADTLCAYKGCNYFSIEKSNDLDEYLVKNFNNVFFPVANNIKLTISSENGKIYKCIGGGKDDFNLFINENKNDDDQIPPPLAENRNEIIFDLGSGFASELFKFGNFYYMKGGLVLLKIDGNKNLDKDIIYNIKLEYESSKGDKYAQDYSYTINFSKQKYDSFSNSSIQKGICIYLFSEILNEMVEYYNNNNLRMQKNIDINLNEKRQSVENFIKANFILDPNNNETKKILNNYIKTLNNKMQEFEKFNKL